MANSPEIEFIIEGAGWARLVIRFGAQSCEIDGISYLSDALDDLIRVGIDVATDRGFSFAQFFHEPGSTILVAENGWWSDKGWESGTRLSTVKGEDYGEGEPTWRGLLDLKRDFIIELSSPYEIAHAILTAADRLKRELGLDGYFEKWTGRLGFPTRGLAALEAALSTPVHATENRDD